MASSESDGNASGACELARSFDEGEKALPGERPSCRGWGWPEVSFVKPPDRRVWKRVTPKFLANARERTFPDATEKERTFNALPR
uniref:Uncharacterized protein n=1 Tax=Vespula pensylvanica TaxID=30213 RepID=A0A834JQ74_VESPE|nr:hypothetical protein H0235_017109 [Vespula pensylvanica]